DIIWFRHNNIGLFINDLTHRNMNVKNIHLTFLINKEYGMNTFLKIEYMNNKIHHIISKPYIFRYNANHEIIYDINHSIVFPFDISHIGLTDEEVTQSLT